MRRRGRRRLLTGGHGPGTGGRHLNQLSGLEAAPSVYVLLQGRRGDLRYDLQEPPWTPALRPPVWSTSRPPPHASPKPPKVAAAAASPGVSRLLERKEVADRLAVSERILKRWRITGERPSYLSITRATVRYTAEAVDGFLAGRAKASTAQR